MKTCPYCKENIQLYKDPFKLDFRVIYICKKCMCELRFGYIPHLDRIEDNEYTRLLFTYINDKCYMLNLFIKSICLPMNNTWAPGASVGENFVNYIKLPDNIDINPSNINKKLSTYIYLI